MSNCTIYRVMLCLTLLAALGGCGRPEQVSETPPPPKDEPKPDQEIEPSTAETEEAVPRPSHEAPAFGQRIAERNEMVSTQIADRPFAQPVKDQKVLTAMRTVPRHAFVSENYQTQAYADRPLSIGFAQTISQPYIVAYMTEMLKLNPEAKVLEIGTGSGYQAAVAAELAQRVYSIEIIKELGQTAGERLKKLGYKNVETRIADGYYGWTEKGPFDAIIVTAASSHVPRPLIEQLKPNGRLVIPLGSPWRAQELVLLTKQADGSVTSQGLMGVRFVPLLGKAQE